MDKMVKTNIGEIPIEDYRDIKARQLGFDDYDDMVSKGYHLDEDPKVKKTMYRVTIIEGFYKVRFLFNYFDKATEFMETALENTENDIEVIIKKVDLEKEKREKEESEDLI